MTPFEVRLDLIRIAENALRREHEDKRFDLVNQYEREMETARRGWDRGTNLSQGPVYPKMPAPYSAADVVALAQELNVFVERGKSYKPVVESTNSAAQ